MKNILEKTYQKILKSLTDEELETETTQKAETENSVPSIPKDDFHTLIATILNKTNIGPINEVNDKISELLDTLDLMNEFEEYLIGRYKEFQIQHPNNTQEQFILTFGVQFKNTHLLEYLPFHAKKINFKVEQAYFDIVKSIKDIQAEIEQPNLRIIAECDLTEVASQRAKLQQCNTPFCLVILKCTGQGKFDIVYSIDQNSIDMIGHTLTSALLRKIYEHTSNELSSYLNVYSLKDECFADFEEVLKLWTNKDFIKINQH
jgi:hypothetical protein